MEKPLQLPNTVEPTTSLDEAIISRHASSGISTLQTPKIMGYIKHHKLVVFIDSGSTHNFINRSKVLALHCFLHPVNNFHILIANGGMMKCGGHCENVKLKIRDFHLKTHMLAIDMGGCDIVFGTKCLHTLGLITMEFKELYIIFVKDYHAHMLQGIKANPQEIINSHHMENLLKKGHSSIITQFHAIQGCETTPLNPSSMLQQVFDTYNLVFELPIRLPPT